MTRESHYEKIWRELPSRWKHQVQMLSGRNEAVMFKNIKKDVGF